MDSYSYISNAETGYIDALYKDYQTNPATVDESWQKFFEGYDLAASQNGHIGEPGIDFKKEAAVLKLINGYRTRGHLLSHTNPVRARINRHPHISPEDFGLSAADMDTSFAAGTEIGIGHATLKEIINHLIKLYCRSMGVEFMHIEDIEVREWFRERFESTGATFKFDIDKEKRILNELNEAVVFENFLQLKYVGQKRFSLEGGETTIPALDAIINKAGELGIKEVVIGMAHRGRLNVLANTLGKTYEYIFSEFEGIQQIDQTMGDGDVKYHLGFHSEVETLSGNKVNLFLAPNPSHLEAVNPVMEGYSRAQADILYDGDFQKVLPVVIHGDAAVAGQGIVYEVAQMSQLKGFYTGGTVHFVINNQIGFTTDFMDARTSTYCSAVAKVSDSPVMHVNGDDAECVVYCVELATEFRQKFNKDIYVDMVCYRKHGHNETDEPKFTQPMLYNIIARHPDPREVYSRILIRRGDIEAQLAKDMEIHFKNLLQDRLNAVKQNPLPYEIQKPEQDWLSLRKATPEDFNDSPDTSVKRETLEQIIKALTYVPDNIHPIKQAVKQLQERQQRWDNNQLNWALGELFAYGTLLLEDTNIRMSGQDVIRGTFSHRHAEIWDEETNEAYCNLNHIADKQSFFQIYNSLLSEYAVLGFEYGYSISSPKMLNLWEAQFGDFANGAQVVIDQFISCAESKWQQMSGLVLLLPHGYEGQGPEHSSARIERYLDLSAEYNMIIANCTTPGNFFHLLRRQLKWQFRKPLVVFTPKSLLRHPLAVSPIEELTDGKFREVIDDTFADAKKVKRVLFCSGKIYYDLLERQQKDKRKDIAIVRIEQLFPMPENKIDAVMAKYPKAENVWVQEEPKNMGAWTYWLRRAEHYHFRLISRKASASPATGFNRVHLAEQAGLVDEAFAG